MSRWLARWRAALRIARRDAWRNKGRTTLVVLLMMLPVAAGTVVITAVRSFYPGVEVQIAQTLGTQAQARLEVACRPERMAIKQDPLGAAVCFGGDDGQGLGQLTQAELAALLPPADAAVVGHTSSVALRSDEALIDAVGVLEVDAGRVPGLVGSIDGQSTPAAKEVVLRNEDAQQLSVGLGDSIELVNPFDQSVTPAEVVGIGEGGQRVLVGPGTLPDSVGPQVWFVTGDAPVTWADVVALNAIGLSVASRSVMADPPPPEQVYGGMFQPVNDSAARTAGAFVAILGLGLLEVILLVGPAFAVGARRSSRSLALVAASGGEPQDLRRIVLAGGIVAGVLAAGTGIAVGMVICRGFFAYLTHIGSPPPTVATPVMEMLGVGLIAVLLGLAAAWVPARTASRVDLVAVLAGRRGERPARRRMAWIGLGSAVIGLVLALLAALVGQSVLLAVGSVVTELGLVLASGALVVLAGRLAPRFGVAGRFALRDARRHRSRTAPAVAAVLAAVAGATLGLVYVASDTAAQRQAWQPVAAEGSGVFSVATDPGSTDDATGRYEAAAAAVTDVLPDGVITQVRQLVPADSATEVVPVPDPDAPCPYPGSRFRDTVDGECIIHGASAGFSWGWIGTIVDDGTLASRTGLPGAEEAAAALARGEVLVTDPRAIWPDGRAHLSLSHDGAGVGEELHVPARLIEWSWLSYSLVLPPGVADQVVAAADGQLGTSTLSVQPVGGLVTGVGISSAQVAQINRQLSDLGEGTYFEVEGGPRSTDNALTLLIVVAAAVLVAIIATGLSVGLAVTDSAADLATLAAVGASPRVRRRITAAQAGVVAGLGALVGVVTGLLLALVLGVWQQGDRDYGMYWQTIVPWPHVLGLLIGLPLAAMGAGWLLTRSRLPVRRRVAS